MDKFSSILFDRSGSLCFRIDDLRMIDTRKYLSELCEKSGTASYVDRSRLIMRSVPILFYEPIVAFHLLCFTKYVRKNCSITTYEKTCCSAVHNFSR